MEEALAFLERWVEDNVGHVAAALRAEQAESLAERCYRDAADADISAEDIDEAASEATDGGTLATYIEQALDSVDDPAEMDEDD